MEKQSTAPTYLYVGTFTRAAPHGRGRSEGIYVYRLDPSSGALTHVQTVAEVPNPSFLTLAPDRRHLYAVNAVPEIDRHSGGALSAFAVDPTSGELTFLNRQAAHGAGPCHVSVDQTGRWAFVASYAGGSAAMLPIQSDGRLGPATDAVEYSGSGPDPVHQDRPHAHSINLDPGNKFALVCNQGLDKIFIYRLDTTRGKLVPNERQPWVPTPPGTGPRHFAFHPNGRTAYAITEQGATLIAYAYDAADGTLRETQTVSTLPSGFSGQNACADVHVHPSGRFLYGSNRGHDSLAIVAIDEATGKLSPVGHLPTGGQVPRNFTFDASGSLLLVANQDSDNIVAFRVDPTTGECASLGVVAEVPTPVCLKIGE